MKKLVLTFIVAVTALMGNAVYGQTELQSATLQQGDKTTVFYGADAFVKAFNAVKNSADVITLSAGSFRSTNINKACSIYGSGYERIDSIGLYPTMLDDLAVVHGTEKDEEGNTISKQGDLDGLYIEGIWINAFNLGEPYRTPLTIKNLTLKRCRFANWLNFAPNGIANCSNYNTNIINCIINNINLGIGGRNFSLYNSIVNNLNGGSTTYDVTALIKNCLIFTYNSIYATFKDNLLFIRSTGNDRITEEYSASSYYQNNVSSVNLFSGTFVTHNYDNWVSKSHISIFGVEIGNEYNPQYTYELKPGNETIYVGTDGTQVGLYGGLYPFTKIPSNPQIISKEIDTNTTVDGKLKVSIKVKAQE